MRRDNYYIKKHLELLEKLNLNYLEETIQSIRGMWGGGKNQAYIKKYAEMKLKRVKSKFKKVKYRQIIEICNNNKLFDEIVFYYIAKK